MDKKTFKVIKGYSELGYSERKEVREFIEKFEKEEFGSRKPLVENLRKSLGPTSDNNCPCCGK